MKAAVCTRYGPPEVLEIKNVDKPVPKANEVLVRIYATTANRTDCGIRAAKYFIVRFFFGLFKPNISIFGTEFAGKVVEIGKNVKSFKIGEKVFGYDEEDFGCYAEYKVISEDASITTIPEGLTYEQAAPIAEGGHYALRDIQKANIQNGQKVLINGATGAIGSAAVQIVKDIGAKVTGVCNTKSLDLVKGLGADKVYDYMKEDFTTDDEKYDVVFDAVGKSSFRCCKKLLKPCGIYMSTELGYMAQNPILALITPILGKKKVIMPIPKHNKEIMVHLKELVEEGKFKPVIDRTYPFEQIIDATRYAETGEKIGNVVLKIKDIEK